MTQLLQAFADRDAIYLTDLRNAIDDETRAIEALPEQKQAQRALAAARTSHGQASHLLDRTKWSIGEMDKLFRGGVNGDVFRLYARSADVLLRLCLHFVESVDVLWNRVEKTTGASDEVKKAREQIAAQRTQLQAMLPQITQWRKIAELKPPTIDPALLELGAEQIRRGQFKTGEQILESIRNRNSST